MGTELKREFSTDFQMSKRLFRKCSPSLAIRKRQVKAILIYHFTPVKNTKIKNTNDSLCWRWYDVRGILIYCWWGWKLVHTLEISMAVYQKIENQPTSGSNNTTLGHIPKRCSIILQRHLYNYVHSTLFVIARTWKQPRRPSTKEWIKKMWHIYTIEYYSVVKTMTSWNSHENGWN